MTLEIALFVVLFALYSWALVRLGRTMGERHGTVAGFARGEASERAMHQFKHTESFESGRAVGFSDGWRACERDRKEAASAAATKGWQKRRASDAAPHLVEGATHG